MWPLSLAAFACFNRRSATEIVDVAGVSAVVGEATVNATGGAEGAAEGIAAGNARGAVIAAVAGRILAR